jgi:hypothetical protein
MIFYDLPPNLNKPAPGLALNFETEQSEISSAAAKKLIELRAKQVIAAIKTKNMSKLAVFVHPTKGLRFSPYSYINTKEDSIFKATQLKNLLASRKHYLWGTFDGSGEPIRMTFANYYKRFIYDKDFANAPVIGYNEIARQGNSTNNLGEIYPNSIFVEYHFSGTEKNSGMDWRSLRLVFEKKGGAWFLVGIIHDQWTI